MTTSTDPTSAQRSATARRPDAQAGRASQAAGTSRRLAVAVASLVLVDAVGGLIAVASGLNDWAGAWGPTALLAAPIPMVAGQVLLTVLCTRTQRRWGVAPAVLLALACFASILSGFFDGGIGNAALTPWQAAYQVFLLCMTGVVGVLAVLRARELLSRKAARSE